MMLFYSRISAALMAALLMLLSPQLFAASATEIDIKVDETLERFKTEVPGGSRFLEQAEGVLVFPSIIKVGFGIGGEYGEGALRINGKTVDYYNTAAGSIGLQLGAQQKSLILVFLDADVLKNFRRSKGWKAGVDGSVAVVEWGTGESVDTIDVEDPIAGFMFSNKGLMFNLNLEGAKFTRIQK